MHAVDPQRVDVADCPVVDPLDHFLPGLGVAPHEADTHLEVLLLGHLGRLQQSATGGAVDGERLLHEDVHALLTAYSKCSGRKAAWVVKHDDVARTEAVDRLPVGVEAEELPLRARRRDLRRFESASRGCG